MHTVCTGLDDTADYGRTLHGRDGRNLQITAHPADQRPPAGRMGAVLNPPIRTYVRVRIPSRAPRTCRQTGCSGDVDRDVESKCARRVHRSSRAAEIGRGGLGASAERTCVAAPEEPSRCLPHRSFPRRTSQSWFDTHRSGHEKNWTVSGPHVDGCCIDQGRRAPEPTTETAALKALTTSLAGQLRQHRRVVDSTP